MFAQSPPPPAITIPANPAPDILAALKSASARTGSDFNYLLSTAMRESGLDSQAQSRASSATGLFQFVDQTWLSLVKKFGDRYGLGQYADAIQQSGSGHYAVASADTKAAILALRKDPQMAALMAGEAANATKEALQCSLGREVCEGELYAAHFLGEGGARQLIQLNQAAPATRADQAFPQAAKANRAAFYHADGAPKTVAELYAWTTGQTGTRPMTTGAASAPIPLRRSVPVQTADVSGAGAEKETAPAGIAGVQWASLRGTEDTGNGQEAGNMTPTLRGAYGIHQVIRTAGLTARTRKLPQTPLLLTPGVMEVLASFSPSRANARRED